MRKLKNKNQTNLTSSNKQGFTIIETSLVTAFMALLMIAIATVTTSISALYRKGITLKAVNSVGRNLITELTTTINSSPSIDSVSLCNSLLPASNTTARNTCIDKNAYNYIYQSWEQRNYRDQATGSTGTIQYGGVLCTGDYSYVWNTYYGLNQINGSNHQYGIVYQDASGRRQEINDDFKMLRFKDPTYLACSVNVNDNYEVSNNHQIDITKLQNGVSNPMSETDFQSNFLQPADVDGSSDISLDLYELTIFPVSQDSVTLRSFFSGTFILATERGEVSIVRSGDYCNVENYQGDTASNLLDLGSEFNYCGINKFNFAARTAGSGI